MQKHMLLADWQHASASKTMLPQGQTNRSWMLWSVLSLFQDQLAQLKGSQERLLSCRAPVQPTVEATCVYFTAPLMHRRSDGDPPSSRGPIRITASAGLFPLDGQHRYINEPFRQTPSDRVGVRRASFQCVCCLNEHMLHCAGLDSRS